MNSHVRQVTWRIGGSVIPDNEAIQQARQRKGKFVLATNQLGAEAMTNEKRLQAYKA